MAFADLSDVKRYLVLAQVLQPGDDTQDVYIQPFLDAATEWVRENYGGNWDAPGPFSVLATPSITGLAILPNTGGILQSATTYSYQVTAVDDLGQETLPSAVSSVTPSNGLLNNSIAVSWGSVPSVNTGTGTVNPVSYKVYGNLSGQIQLLASVAAGLNYTDTGLVTPSGPLPTQAQEVFYNVRQDDIIKLQDKNPTNLTVQAYWLADSTPLLLPQFVNGQFMDSNQWILQGGGLLQMLYSGYVTPVGLENAVARSLAGTYQKVAVTYNPSAVVPLNVRDAVATIAAASFNQAGLDISGVDSESVSEYHYSIGAHGLVIPPRARERLGSGNYRYPLAVVI